MRAVLCLAALLAFQDAPPPIGLVEFYGLRHVAEAPVRQAVGLQAGDAFPENTTEIVAYVETAKTSHSNGDRNCGQRLMELG